MKDAFFRLVEKINNWVYCVVLWWTYTILRYKRSGKLPKLSGEERKKIQNYWKQHYGKKIPLYEYKWYKAKGTPLDPRIIPDVIWHNKIEPHFANVQMEKAFSDKNYFDLVVGKANSPETVCHCINYQLLDERYQPLSPAEVCEKVKAAGEVICKPSIDSGGGRSIQFLKSEDATEENIQGLVAHYGGNFIVQKLIEQHEFFSRFNPTSLNTMRFATFLYQGEVHILSGGLRIGRKDSRVDNLSSGGYYIQFDSDGNFFNDVITDEPSLRDYIRYQALDNRLDFTNLRVPYLENVQALIRTMHYRLPHFRIINWDIAVDKNATPIVVEYNLLDLSPDLYQLNLGPFFGDLTEKVLDEI